MVQAVGRLEQVAGQDRDMQIQQRQTLVFEMTNREGTLMQCILGLDRRLADLERRPPRPYEVMLPGVFCFCKRRSLSDIYVGSGVLPSALLLLLWLWKTEGGMTPVGESFTRVKLSEGENVFTLAMDSCASNLTPIDSMERVSFTEGANRILTLRRDLLGVVRFPRWVEAKVVSSEVESEE
ncbi:hypothetical protein Tco_0337219 [Tanacetum coccineum]